MGGNAFKKHPGQRLNKIDFDNSSRKVNDWFNKNNIRNNIVPAYAEKETFGDLDLVVETESMEMFFENHNIDPDKFKELLKVEFHSREYLFRFPVYSFEYRENNKSEKGFQVDLIHLPEKFYQFGLSYLSYNDIGNLLGVIYRNMGLKFGHYGLNYEIKTKETHKIGEILVSDDFDHTLGFIGLNAERYHQGFKNYEEIFQYVVSSPYFNKNLYKLEEGVSSYKSRRRNAQRGTYRAFLDWLELPAQSNLNAYVHTRDNKERLKLIGKYFGEGFANNILEVKQKEIDRLEGKKKVDGELVSSWTGLTNQALGYLMSTLKSHYKSTEDFENWLIIKSKEEVKDHILKLKETLSFEGMLGDPNSNPVRMSVKKTKLKKNR